MAKAEYQKSTAEAQLAAYTFQLLQGLNVLVAAPNNSRVGLEIFDDITIEKNTILTQTQVKRSQNSDVAALTNLNENVWRTFIIWMSYIEDKDPACENTNFMLMTNTPVNTRCFLAAFKNGGTEQLADDALSAIKTLTTDDEKIRTYIDRCIGDAGIGIFRTILSKLTVVDNQNANPDVAKSIAEKLPIHGSVDRIAYSNQIIGWYVAKVMNAFDAREQCWITKSELNNAILNATIDLVRPKIIGTRELNIEPDKNFASEAMNFVFIKQLKLIGSEKPADLQKAAHDYFRFCRAKDNHIERGEILPDMWESEEKRFIENWQQVMQFENMSASTNTDEVQIGRNIYANTLKTTNFPPLNGNSREQYIISGHYHVLADKLSVWWHPRCHELVEREL